MKIYILSDNNCAPNLINEWGLSILIEYEGKKVLLDAGASNAFLHNSIMLGLDLQEVDFAVVSHAHFDHCDGFPFFMEINTKAPLFIQKGTEENCYDLQNNAFRYVGIPRGMLHSYSSRINYVKGKYCIYPNVFLLSHTVRGDEFIPSPNHFILEGNEYRYDRFNHEQSLVYNTELGIIIFSSCSHTGFTNIISEVQNAFPDKKIKAFVGGLHIFDRDQTDLQILSKDIEKIGIEKIYTGHCTGQAITILQKNLGSKIEQFYAGMIINI